MSAARVSEIVTLLRRVTSRKLHQSLTEAATAGDLETMELFVANGAKLEERSVGFVSPLAACTSAGKAASMRWLLARGAVLAPPGTTVPLLSTAVGHGNGAAAEVLLEAGAPIAQAAWGCASAALVDNLPMVRWILARGLDRKASYPHVGQLEERLRLNATKGGHSAVLAWLDTESVDPEPLTPPERPPYVRPDSLAAQPVAAEDERSALLAEARRLIAAGKNVSRWQSKRPQGLTGELLLSYAAEVGVLEVVQALVEKGADPNFVEPGAPPPLTSAAGAAEREIVLYLLEKGAKPNGVLGRNWLPLDAALTSGDPETVKILLRAGANPKAKPGGGRTLLEVVRGPYEAELRGLLTAGGAK